MDATDLWEHEAKDAADAMFQVMADCGRDPHGSATHPYRTMAVEACDRALSRIEEDMASPMTDAARRYVELFTERENVKGSDVSSALAAFGSQHAAARMIIERARELGVPCTGTSEDEVQHYAFELIRECCRTLSFKDERDRPIDQRSGYRMLLVAVSDWANWVRGRDSLLGNDMGPLAVPESGSLPQIARKDVSMDNPGPAVEKVPDGLLSAFSRNAVPAGFGFDASRGGDER